MVIWDESRILDEGREKARQYLEAGTCLKTMGIAANYIFGINGGFSRLFLIYLFFILYWDLETREAGCGQRGMDGPVEKRVLLWEK